MGAGDILNLMQAGKTIQRFVTIPEGMPSILVWERLMAEERLKGKVAIPAEGSVLPDTYAYTTRETRAAVLKRMQAAMDKAFAALWAQRSPRSAATARHPALTLPSLFDTETLFPATRRPLAAVFPHRLSVLI